MLGFPQHGNEHQDGFKLHLAINHRGELLNVALTRNIDDRKPVKELLKEQFGQFFGDKGYISAPLARDLRDSNVILVTKFKKNMNNRLMTMLDKQLLRKRAIIESVIEQLKHPLSDRTLSPSFTY